MYDLSKINNESELNFYFNTTLAFMYILSVQYYMRSTTVICDIEKTSYVGLHKMGSKYGLELTFLNLTAKTRLKTDEDKSYLVFRNSKKDYGKIIKARPKLILGVFWLGDNDFNVSSFFSDFVIHPKTSFFVITLSQNQSENTTGKTYYLYKPIPNVKLKVIPVMTCPGSNDTQSGWNWTTGNMNWIAMKKKTFDMSGITITIALASTKDTAPTFKNFWTGKNAFFWKECRDFLKFNAVVHIEEIPAELVKSITKVYMRLLMTNTDGLGVLPVITSERSLYLDFIVTGLDSRFHLIVRPPQFIHSWQSVFKPFTFTSWICLAMAILLMSVTLRFITFSQKVKSMDFSSCFLVVLGFVCGQGSADIPRLLSARMACYTALLFSFSIYQFYTSNFYSLLSTKEASLPFNSLEQFLEKKTHKLYIHPDTAIYSQITNAKNGTFKRLWDEVLKNDPRHQLKSDGTRGRALENVCKGKGAILGLPFQIAVMNELRCKLVTVNAGYFPTNIVSIFRKRFTFKPQFKFVHMRLLEGGISHKYRDEFLNIERKRTIRTNVTNEPVSLEHIAFLLIFYGASVIISLGILGLEIIASKSICKPLKFKFNTSTTTKQPNTKHFFNTSINNNTFKKR